MLAVAFGLSSRIQVGSTQIRRTFTTALSILGVVAVLGLFAGATSFSDWWRSLSFWSLVINWLTLVVVLVLVHRELKRRAGGDQSGPRPHWG
jgi:nitrogen fixation/metabolism regulation signal transduction histidine kinase